MNGKQWYQEVYLQSQHWIETRAKALEAAENCCQKCNETFRLQVHHLTYDRIWHEEPSDLIVLCHNCHSKEHGKTWDGHTIYIHHSHPPDEWLDIPQRIAKTQKLGHYARGLLIYLLSNKVKKDASSVEDAEALKELEREGYVTLTMEDGDWICTAHDNPVEKVALVD